MSLNRFRGQLQSRIKLLDTVMDNKTNSLKTAPPGFLKILKCGKYSQFILVSEGNKTYISTKNLDLIQSMVQKSYDRNVLELAAKEKVLLEDMLREYPDVTFEECYESLPQNRKELIHPIWPTDEEFVAAWVNAPFERKRSDDSEFVITTNRGEKVRSKSEKIIADKLAERGIPYRYEAKLVLNDGTVIHPDFTILDIRRRREVYLEHMGMMDDSVYATNAVRRMRSYERNGIMIGDRLLLTFETSRIPIDMRTLDHMLDDFYVPTSNIAPQGHEK